MTGAVDLESARFVVTDFDSLEKDEYTTAILASASVPGVFPWTEFQGMKLIDSLASGWNVNMISAIAKCMEVVDDPRKITLDVIVMYPDRIKEVDGEMNTIHNYQRIKELRSYYTLMSDIAEFMRANPDINYRYFVQASEAPISDIQLLNFSRKNVDKCVNLGMKDA